ncbi:ferric reductase [Trichoderma velutinum]
MDPNQPKFASTTTFVAPSRSVWVISSDSSGIPSNPTIAPYTTGLDGVNEMQNELFTTLLWSSLGAAAMAIFLIRVTGLIMAKLRQISLSVPRDKQDYWKYSQWSWMPWVKKHIIYAPLFQKRHNQEFRLSTAVSVGTLPSRLQAMLLFLYFASNVAYMFILDWAQPNYYSFCAELRGRAGTLALENMVPLAVMAGRNNPFISALQISFDTFNLLHRWIGRIIVVEIVVHTVAWAIPNVTNFGWGGSWKSLMNSPFLGVGGIGTAALVLISVQAISPLRHAFYETFLNLHIMLAGVVFACAWIHCVTADVPGGLPQLPWITATVSLWVADRLARVVRLARASWSDNGLVEALCEPLHGEDTRATRVTIDLPDNIEIKPGTHAYLRFWDLNAWESHPFSIAWVDRKVPAFKRETSDRCSFTSVSFLISARSGMTQRLFHTAERSQKALSTRVTMEGPYAGHHSLDSYGHVVLFAGSTGITHQISYLQHLLEGYDKGTIATRRVFLVWVIRESKSLLWIAPFLDHIPPSQNILHIQVFVTQLRDCEDTEHKHSSIKSISGGRPNIPLLLNDEVQQQIGAMLVTVCGPGALADDVRDVVRSVQAHTVIDFIEESFTW